MKPSSCCSLGGLLLTLFTGLPSSALAETSDVQAPSVVGAAMLRIAGGEGELRKTPGSAWKPAAAGVVLASGCEVRTGAKPMRLELPDGTLLELGPKSTILAAGSMDIVIARTRSSALHIALRAGQLGVETSAASERIVLVSAGDLQAAVFSGSSARLHFAPFRRESSAALYSGDARFATRGAWRPLEAARVVELLGPGRPVRVSPLGPAPEWGIEQGPASPGAVGIVTSDDGTARLGVRWAQVSSAHSYLAEVARDDAFLDVVERLTLPATAPELVTRPLPAGRYFVRVSTCGASGLPGMPGPSRPLRVVRVTLPSGAVAQGDAWILPEKSRVGVADPEGLEAAVAQHGFLPATPEVRFAGDVVERLALRLRGESSFVAVRMEPRALRARVELTPRFAVWPYDPVDITVRLEQREKGPVPFEPALQVRVNRSDVPIDWHRTGNSIRGRLDPQVAPGPWLVQVNVADPFGNEIGRGFLEVISPEPAPDDIFAAR